MTRDDVADVVKRELAAKLAAAEEENADGEAGADQAASGVKRDRKSRGGRGSSHRGGGDSDSESAGEDDELGVGDPDILAELEEDSAGCAAGRHAVSGAGAPGLLFASQDVQLARHADYIAEEEYEGQVRGLQDALSLQLCDFRAPSLSHQVTVAAVAQTDQDDRERSAARTTAIEGLHDEHRHRKAKRQRRKRGGDDAEAVSAAAPHTRLPPLRPPDSPPPGSGGPGLAEDDASSEGGLGDGGVTRALQKASGLVVVPVVGRGRRPPAGGVAAADVKPFSADVKPALQSLEGLPASVAAPQAPALAAPPSARVTSGYCSLGDSEGETGDELAVPVAPAVPVVPVAPLAAAALRLLPSRPRDTIDELCDDVA